MHNKSIGDRVFDTANVIFMLLFSFMCIYPFLYVFNISISAGSSAAQYGLGILPKNPTLAYYKQVFRTDAVPNGFKNSIIRTVVGTILAVIVTACGAYPLSKRNLPNRNFWTMLVLIPMFFGGGLIPSYLLMRSLKLLNTRWALILPSLVSTYNLILIRNFMMSLPDSLEESAKIDGANEITILFKIILPVSKSIIATIALWVAVAHWNAWFDCLIYVTNDKLNVLQVVLFRVINAGSERTVTGQITSEDVYPETLKACTTMVTTIPIIMVYPFAQKYFIQGIMVGSLKG